MEKLGKLTKLFGACGLSLCVGTAAMADGKMSDELRHNLVINGFDPDSMPFDPVTIDIAKQCPHDLTKYNMYAMRGNNPPVEFQNVTTETALDILQSEITEIGGSADYAVLENRQGEIKAVLKIEGSRVLFFTKGVVLNGKEFQQPLCSFTA